jgi:hypothetical protein
MRKTQSRLSEAVAGLEPLLHVYENTPEGQSPVLDPVPFLQCLSEMELCALFSSDAELMKLRAATKGRSRLSQAITLREYGRLYPSQLAQALRWLRYDFWPKFQESELQGAMQRAGKRAIQQAATEVISQFVLHTASRVLVQKTVETVPSHGPLCFALTRIRRVEGVYSLQDVGTPDDRLVWRPVQGLQRPRLGTSTWFVDPQFVEAFWAMYRKLHWVLPQLPGVVHALIAAYTEPELPVYACPLQPTAVTLGPDAVLPTFPSHKRTDAPFLFNKQCSLCEYFVPMTSSTARLCMRCRDPGAGVTT